MSTELSLKEIKKEWHGTYQAYAIGFFASLFLTGLSFYLVISHTFSTSVLSYTIVGLALVQAAVQLRFFLHLGQEAKPLWETIVFFFMLVILLIICLGSLWVMNDLNSRMMPDMTKELLNHEQTAPKKSTNETTHD